MKFLFSLLALSAAALVSANPAPYPDSGALAARYPNAKPARANLQGRAAATQSLPAPDVFGPGYRLNGAVEPSSLIQPTRIPREPGTHNFKKFDGLRSFATVTACTRSASSTSSSLPSMPTAP